MARRIRLGTASPCTQATTPETLAQLESIAKRAAEQGVDLLLLPEAYIGGYPRGSTFGCAVGARTEEGRDEYLRYFQSAVDLGDTVGVSGAGAGEAWVNRQLPPTNTPDTTNSPTKSIPLRGDGTRAFLERVARETGVFIVTGLIERAGGSLYCAAVYVDPARGIIGKRRKVMPTGTERLIWAQGSPATLRAVSTMIKGVRLNLAAAICWENYMPLLRQSLYSQNINLWLAPTADGRDAWASLMRTVAIEGRCFVVASNMCVPKPGSTARQTQPSDEAISPTSSTTTTTTKPRTGLHKRRQSVFDEDGNEIVLCCKTDSTDINTNTDTVTNVNGTYREPRQDGVNGEKEFVCRGGSCIINPFGDVLAGPQWEDDHSLIYVDVDFEDCIRGRLDLDAAGSYSRNDSFKFSVEGLDLSPLPY
ncbi:nitrilase-like protein [Diplogelasinospora grovesii]|uniref:Nitrilase-like protein n=1 Tax=Diplogelasinospora grovesii TaxID=303347 RepID=A0AAN6S479_9PEZI|nr:nitrilase-like protein [Diplogelasinospora grovesii]